MGVFMVNPLNSRQEFLTQKHDAVELRSYALTHGKEVPKLIAHLVVGFFSLFNPDKLRVKEDALLREYESLVGMKKQDFTNEERNNVFANVKVLHDDLTKIKEKKTLERLTSGEKTSVLLAERVHEAVSQELFSEQFLRAREQPITPKPLLKQAEKEPFKRVVQELKELNNTMRVVEAQIELLEKGSLTESKRSELTDLKKVQADRAKDYQKLLNADPNLKLKSIYEEEKSKFQKERQSGETELIAESRILARVEKELSKM